MNELATTAPSGELVKAPTRPSIQFVEPAMPAARRDSARSTIAGRKSADFIFAPRESTFFFEENVTLNSRAIQITYEVTFERCQLALFETELIAPLIARDDDGVRAINASVDLMFKRFEETIEGEMNRINKLIRDNGKPIDRGSYTSSQIYGVKVYTPRSLRYLQLLKLADEMITTYNRAWLHGFMDEVHFKRCVFSTRMRAIQLARKLWELHTRGFVALRRARHKADEDRQRLRLERQQARQATHEQPAEATDTPSAPDQDATLQDLDARVAKADALLSDLDNRGGMESEVPDFGTSDLRESDPALMAKEEAAASKRRTPRRATPNDADATPAESVDA